VISPCTTRSDFLAWVLPFALFVGFLALVQGVGWLVPAAAGSADPRYWIYPVQTLACAGVLVWFWRRYPFSPGFGPYLIGFGVGVLALAIWLSPQFLFGVPPRREGFNPDLFAGAPAFYWVTLLGRFARLVLVVPLLEEIFWRGFLMRYLISEDFISVPFGKFAPLAFGAVAALFAFEHTGADLWPALATGILYNAVAVWTRSLGACVVAHATTNLGLGLFIVATKQWGFW